MNTEESRPKEAPQPHTQLTHAIGTDRAIIMGDPARVDTIATSRTSCTGRFSRSR